MATPSNTPARVSPTKSSKTPVDGSKRLRGSIEPIHDPFRASPRRKPNFLVIPPPRIYESPYVPLDNKGLPSETPSDKSIESPSKPRQKVSFSPHKREYPAPTYEPTTSPSPSPTFKPTVSPPRERVFQNHNHVFCSHPTSITRLPAAVPLNEKVHTLVSVLSALQNCPVIPIIKDTGIIQMTLGSSGGTLIRIANVTSSSPSSSSASPPSKNYENERYFFSRADEEGGEIWEELKGNGFLIKKKWDPSEEFLVITCGTKECEEGFVCRLMGRNSEATPVKTPVKRRAPRRRATPKGSGTPRRLA